MATSNFDEYFDSLVNDVFGEQPKENNDTETNVENQNNENDENDEFDDFDGVGLNDVISLSNNEKAQPQIIKCENRISISGNNFKKITHEAVDKLDFNNLRKNGKSLVEFLIKPEYVRFYIDVDEVNNVEEYLKFRLWLESLSSVFGKYSIGGYTNSEQFANYGFRLWPESEKTLSLHVVFYETCISSVDLMDIMKQKNYKFINYDVNPLCDGNVYKLNARQAFRHVLTDKIYSKKDDDKYKPNHGFILNNDKPSTQIITVRGGEPIITKELWLKVFTPINKTEDVKQEVKQDVKQNVENKDTKPKQKTDKQFYQYELKDIEYDEKLIMLPDDELIKLLNCFECHNHTLIHEIAPLYNSPYTKEKLIEVITIWFNQTPHKTPDDITDIVNKYYHYEANNKWLFSLIKKIDDDDKREEWRNMFIKEVVDTTQDINNSNYCFNDLRKKKFGRYQLPSIITMLRGCVAQCQGLYYMKEKINGQFIISKYTKERFTDILKLCKPFKGNTNINLYQIFSKYSDNFTYDDIKLSKTNEDNIINYFQGYKHKEVITDDFTILQPLLNHVKHVICNDDEKKYEYIMNWFANIVQNLSVKNGTLPIIHGAQGSGKSCFAELMCELLGNLAIYNNDDLDKVFGKFNSISDG